MKHRALRIISFILLLVLLLSTTAVAATAATPAKPLEELIDRKPDKEIVNILMIGNSFCFYYVEELAGMAAASGKEINVCNLYYSGCSLEQHWNYYENDESQCQFWHTNSERRVELPIKKLTDALDYAEENLGSDWDVISLQQTPFYSFWGTAEYYKSNTLFYADKLYDVIKQRSPDALLYWHQTWSFEIGFGADKTNPSEKMDTLEKQTNCHIEEKKQAKMVAEAEGVNIVPSGDAWNIVRSTTDFGQTLCYRKGLNNDLGDRYHDGDIGGGQYLNACVWYEILMGESCVGNTWRPDNYELSEEKIGILQNAAHEAVAAHIRSLNLATKDAASIRVSTVRTGLRFKTDVSKELINALCETYGKENVSVGTLITTADILGTGELTHAFSGKYIDVPASLDQPFSSNNTTNTYSGSVVNVKESNLDRDFIGVGYVKVTVSGQDPIYYYSAQKCTRNISYVAACAYADTRTASGSEYLYKVTSSDKYNDQYSPYTSEQRNTIRSLIRNDGVEDSFDFDIF